MSKALLQFHMRLSELERRLAGTVRHAPVAEVNAAEGWVRLDFGEGDKGKLLSPKIPYAQMAGALKVHSPPSVGQNMTIMAPGGDMRQAVALPMTWSDQNAAPSNKGDENVLTFGSVRMELRGDEIKISIGGFSLTMTADNAVFEVGGVKHEISGGGVDTTGGMIRHDDRNIGSSHKHGGIERGGSLTDPPS
jgi:hypothetical protein